jgi:hypothetical protein
VGCQSTVRALSVKCQQCVNLVVKYMYNVIEHYMSTNTKSKTIAFRVTEQDFNTLSELANRLHQKQQTNHANPHLLAKEYCFSIVIVMKLNGFTQTTEQDNAIFTLAKRMASTINPEGQQQGYYIPHNLGK